MRKNLVIACAMAFFGLQAARYALSQEKGKEKDQRSDYCICLTEEFMDYGFFSEYLADLREHACNQQCEDPTATTWYGREDWPQLCEVANDCMTNAHDRSEKKNTPIALDRPVGPYYEPTLGKHLADIAKIIHVDCITIHPPDRDPLTAKVFLVLIPARKIPYGDRELNRPAMVWATGVEVKELRPNREADATTQHQMFENVYHAKVGPTTYNIVTTPKQK